VPNSAEVKKRLAANPSAIGYIGREFLDGSVKVVLAP
jgi:ABC-type phosphate transport system substrate-binding protein